jgi:hypothetical protein
LVPVRTCSRSAGRDRPRSASIRAAQSSRPDETP